MSAAHTIKDVARAVLSSDSAPGVRLPAIEQTLRVALINVLGRNAAFEESGECRVDLGNSFTLVCTVLPTREVFPC